MSIYSKCVTIILPNGQGITVGTGSLVEISHDGTSCSIKTGSSEGSPYGSYYSPTENLCGCGCGQFYHESMNGENVIVEENEGELPILMSEEVNESEERVAFLKHESGQEDDDDWIGEENIVMREVEEKKVEDKKVEDKKVVYDILDVIKCPIAEVENFRSFPYNKSSHGDQISVTFVFNLKGLKTMITMPHNELCKETVEIGKTKYRVPSELKDPKNDAFIFMNSGFLCPK